MVVIVVWETQRCAYSLTDVQSWIMFVLIVWRIKWELITGDDGVGFRGVSFSSYEMRLDYTYFLCFFHYPDFLRYFSVSLRDSGKASNSSSVIVWTTSVISLIFFFVQSFFCSLFFSVPSLLSLFSLLLGREIVITFCLKIHYPDSSLTNVSIFWRKVLSTVK